jgi:hypothetical protein
MQWILPHQFFFFLTFSNEIKLVSKFLPQKKEVQNTRHTQSCWLVALLFTMIGLLRHRSREPIFVVLQEAMTSILFSVVLGGCELLTSQ